MSQSYTDNAKVFKAFCDENRFQILEMLKNGEKWVDSGHVFIDRRTDNSKNLYPG